MKYFTENDVLKGNNLECIYCDKRELMYDPPEWMKRGRQETASGYGKRLNSGYKINFCGKLYRIYATICSNVGTFWFKTKGRKILVS